MSKLTKFILIFLVCYAIGATIYVVDTKTKLNDARKQFIEIRAEVDKQNEMRGEYYQFSKDLVSYMMVAGVVNAPDFVADMREVLTAKGYSDIELRFQIPVVLDLINERSLELYGVGVDKLINFSNGYVPLEGRSDFMIDVWR